MKAPTWKKVQEAPRERKKEGSFSEKKFSK